MDLHEHTDLLRAARDEVGWYFAAADAAMGLHAQCIGDSSSSGIWDDAKIARAHAARRSIGHRADVARNEKVRSTLAKLSPLHRTDLELAYRPFGWGRIDGRTVKEKDRANWAVYCRFSVKGRQLLPLALSTDEMFGAYERTRRKQRRHVPGTFADLLAFVCEEVDALRNEDVRPGKAFPSGHKLQPALWAAERRETEAIVHYDELRRARIDDERRPNREYLERLRYEAELRDSALFEAKLRAPSKRVA